MSSHSTATASCSRNQVFARRALACAPEAFVALLVAVAIASGITVTLGIHRPYVTIPLAAALLWVLWRIVRPRARDDRAESGETAATARHEGRAQPRRDVLIAHGALLIGLVVWMVLGFVYASQYLIVSRDPGFLALTGVWLTDHPSTDIPSLGTVDAVKGHLNMLADAWQAWNLRGDMIQPQGAKMLPAVLAVGGWVGGVTGVLWTNVVIGAGALASVYVVAKRLLSPLRALLPVGILGLTVAHIALSRSPYSEPLTLLLLFAAIGWAFDGIVSRRIGPIVAAAIASGATSLVRIDGAAYALGVLAGLVVASAFLGSWGRRATTVFVAAQALAVAVGYASLWRWSEAYVERLGSEAWTLGVAYGAVALATAFTMGAIHLAKRSAHADAPHEFSLPRGFGIAAAGATAATMVLLAARPLFFTDHRGDESRTDKFTNSVVKIFQEGEGYPVDPTRTYAEHTVTWLSYYLTWPVLIVATLGLALMALKAFNRGVGVLVPLGAFAVPSAIYLLRPAVVPDQIWAIRRFEPATIPVLALAAGVGAWYLADLATRRLGTMASTSATAVTALSLAAVMSTYVSVDLDDESKVLLVPYVNSTELDGARPEIEGLCDVIDGRPVVLSGSAGHFGSVRVMCDVPVVLALTPPSATVLASLRESLGEDLVIVGRKPEALGVEEASAVLSPRVTRGEYGLQHLPRRVSVDASQWYLGTIDVDGAVTPVVADASDALAPQG